MNESHCIHVTSIEVTFVPGLMTGGQLVQMVKRKDVGTKDDTQ